MPSACLTMDDGLAVRVEALRQWAEAYGEEQHPAWRKVAAVEVTVRTPTGVTRAVCREIVQ